MLCNTARVRSLLEEQTLFSQFSSGPDETIKFIKRSVKVMFRKNDYPILEFDDNRDAKINPVMWVDKKFECNKLIITFSRK